MKKLIVMILLTIAMLSCNKDVTKVEHDEFLFGTMLRFVIYTDNEKSARDAIDLAIEEMKRIDKSYNTKSEGSILWKLNENPTEAIGINDELIMLLGEVEKISEETEGYFDMTVAPLVNLWGFDDLIIDQVPNTEEIVKTLELVDYKTLNYADGQLYLKSENQRVDTGAFLKGYAIKRAKKVLEKNGIDSAFISAISSIETIGKKANGDPWKIGVQNPSNQSELLKVVGLEGKAMGVSGDYQTYVEIDGKRYHHILNPKSGYPSEKIKMLVVIANDSFEADLYSTALFSMNVEEIMEEIEGLEGIEGLVVDNKGDIIESSGMKKYLK